MKNTLVFGLAFSVLVSLAGCAAQNSHRVYYQATSALEKAEAKDPKSSSTAKAKAALDQGKAHLKSAKYDLAFQSFRESIRLSEEVTESQKAKLVAPVIEAPKGAPSTAEASKLAPTMNESPKKEAAAVVAPAATAALAPIKSRDDNEVRSLPAEALAKYLASKRMPSTPEKPTQKAQKLAEKLALEAPIEKIKPAAKSPAVVAAIPPSAELGGSAAPTTEKTGEKAIEKADEKSPESEAEKMTEKPAEETQKEWAAEVPSAAAPVTGELSDAPEAPNMEGAGSKAPVGKSQVVKSDSAVSDKMAPHALRPIAPVPVKAEVVKAKEAPKNAELPKAKAEKSKTKIPGALRFDQNETELKPDSMLNLDQTSKFLLENPSTSLVFQGILGPGEASNLLDIRFEGLRSYLIGKGVPEDQVRLDTKRRAAASAEFEMFLIEH